MTIREDLLAMQDPQNAAFQAKLTPGIERDCFLGIRVPLLRTYAKELAKCPERAQECEAFMASVPHHYFDENMLHALLISNIKNYSECLCELEHFLPFVDNWAVCDILSPTVFKKQRQALLEEIPAWIASPHPYMCRFGIEMLMSHFLDVDFDPRYLELPAAVRSSEYYVNMMIAWYFATALAKQWDASLPYLQEQRLEKWVHNKTIQKAIESRRITDEQKSLLRSMKRT